MVLEGLAHAWGQNIMAVGLCNRRVFTSQQMIESEKCSKKGQGKI
jgi:hypothetical protein